MVFHETNQIRRVAMKSKRMLISVGIVTSLAVVSGIAIHAAQDQNKYALKVPNGLAVSEFKGYESWQLISISQRGDTIAAILGNPVIIEAYKGGIPGNGKPFPDGSKMAKIHWNAKKADTEPGDPTVLATQHDIDFMVKDSKRFPDGHGWGYGAFELDAATNIPSGSPICRITHHRRMTRSAGLRVTMPRRIGTTFLHDTRRGERRGWLDTLRWHFSELLSNQKRHSLADVMEYAEPA
jgi:hypothetical protein